MKHLGKENAKRKKQKEKKKPGKGGHAIFCFQELKILTEQGRKRRQSTISPCAGFVKTYDSRQWGKKRLRMGTTLRGVVCLLVKS